MAEFCYSARAEIFGNGEDNDFRGLCAEDECVRVLCDGGGDCPGGYHYVTSDGRALRELRDRGSVERIRRPS